jgi:CheY-like chemotaxis protein/HPt (histidine-containing phosphotransfer) domain-containing protein
MHHDRAREKELGIEASLVKPVKAAELLSVINTVMGANGRPTVRTEPKKLSRTKIPSRILVAEDSLVNQALIERLLEKWGHTPLIAENGSKVLSMLDEGQFDLILMDLQMPEVNGFEATAAIRRKEQDSGTHIPIIALTAHALKGDRERCLEAGMDDYVSKPIDSQTLFDAIEIALHQRKSAAANEPSAVAAIDIDALVKSVDGDRELIVFLAKIFADSSPDQLSALSDALARKDAQALAQTAHALKGSVANFRAGAAVDAAARLENIGRNGDLSLAESAIELLEMEIERLRQDLKTFEEVSLV